jgi:uncharacterized protein YdhG (YjbR/CyaY superfamily)
LVAYSLSKGTIRFDPSKSLPKALVRKLVKARIAERAGTARVRKPAKGPLGLDDV